MMGSLMNFLNHLLPKGSAFRHVSIIAGGTTVAQTLNIIVMPFVARIYSPEDFGILAAFTATTSILVQFSGLRYHRAIPLPKQDRYANAIVCLSLFLQAIFVFFITLVLFSVGKSILEKLSISVLIPYRYLIPIAIAGTGIYITFTQWAIRKRFFTTISKTKITQSLTGIFTKIILGLIGLRPLGLLLGNIASQAGGIITLAKAVLREETLTIPPKEEIKRVAIRFRKFPIYETFSVALNTVGIQLTPLLLIMFYSPEVAGFFSMARSLLLLPTKFIGDAIAQVFIQRASVARYQGNIKELSLSTYKFLLQLGLFPILLIAFFAPPLFTFALGEKWIEAGEFAMVLGPWIALAFAYSPMRILFSVLNRQGTEFLQEILYTFIRIIAFIIGSKIGGPLLSIAFFGGAGFFLLLFRMTYILMATGNKLKEILRTDFRLATETALLLMLPLGLSVLNANKIPIVFSIILAILFYLMRCYSFYSKFKKKN